MIHLQRGPAPNFWTRKRVREWKDRWIAKGCKSDKWQWPQYQKKGINEYARETMEIWHHRKCAFCEKPLLEGAEIEHFRSKTQYPLAAFIWRNLFLICGVCNQKKGSENHEGCLKPDREDPAEYLWVNPISLKIEPKPGISEEACQRATKTIKRYGLDRPRLTGLYKEYLTTVSHGHFFPLAGLAFQAQEGNLKAARQIPLRLAGLQSLIQPHHPFSLTVKSLLEYYGISVPTL